MPPLLGFSQTESRKKKKVKIPGCPLHRFWVLVPAPRDLMPSDLCGHHAYKWYTDTQAKHLHV